MVREDDRNRVGSRMDFTDSVSSIHSVPQLPSDSPGSSVSTRLMDEYDELLKYAVVLPTFDPMLMPKSLTDIRGSFPVNVQEGDQDEHKSSESDSGTDVGESCSQIEGTIPGLAQLPEQAPKSAPRSPYVGRGEREQTHRKTVYTERDQSKGRLFTELASELDSPRSQLSPNQEEDHAVGFSLTIDNDVARMEGLMATWLGDLNRNVLAEFGQSKIRLLEYYRQQLQKEKERHRAEVNRMQNETEGVKELLLTYEQSIERKDEVIANLTRAMQRQRDKFEMSKTFCEWKIRHNDKKREAFASNLAKRHYERVLAQKVWDGWHSIVESRWRQRVEKACQAKAQEVCMTLTNDYESKIASTNEALEASRTEVNRLHVERDRYEETMKKAFMRGVCALNLEAMTMFQEGEDAPAGDGGTQETVGMEEARLGLPFTIPQEAVFTTEPPGAPSPRVVTSQGATTARTTISQASYTSTAGTHTKTKAGLKGKAISAKLSARSDVSSGRGSLGSGNVQMGLAPPMSSVIVERHQPVTKQTIGHATASQYPRQGAIAGQAGTSGIVQRRIAGQSRQVPIAMPNVQTIKMVE